MNKEYHIIGLMSGTSLDGEILKCTFINDGYWSFNLIDLKLLIIQNIGKKN